MSQKSPREVETRIELRVTYPPGPGKLAEILETVRRSGGALHAHLAYRIEDESVVFLVCEKAEEAALALEAGGFTLETETVVVARAEDLPGAVEHMIRALEAEGVEIGYSYATGCRDDLCVVFRTADNPKAEDVLRSFLILPDEEAS